MSNEFESEEKDFKQMRDNFNNKQKTKEKLIANAKKELGFDPLNDYHIKPGTTLDYDYFKKPHSVKMAIPFSDAQLNHFMSMEKTLVEETKIIRHTTQKDDFQVYCAYLKGVDTNGKEVLFAFSITRPFKSYYSEGEFFKFNIKLDMLVGGKKDGAVTLMRFDSAGPKHPNYIVNGKFVKREEDAEIIPTPHYHKNTAENIIVASQKLDYTPAVAVDKEIVNMRNNEDKKLFKTVVKSFTDSANMNVKYNNSDYYTYNYNQLLFEFNYGSDMKSGKGRS